MQLDAPVRKLNRKCRRMRPLIRAALDCLVRNEPRVATTAFVTPVRVLPTRDVALVRVTDTYCDPVERHITMLGQMENVFVTIGDEALRVHRLEVPYRNFLTSAR